MRLLRVAMGGLMLAGLAAGCGGDNQEDVRLALTRPGPRVTVEGNVVELDLSTSNIAIEKADGNRSGRSGHFHVFIDKDPVEPGEVIPAEAGIVHTDEDPITIAGLTTGAHKLTVVLGDGTHRRIGKSAVSTEVTVKGPSVTLTAPAFSPTQRPVSLQLATEGVAIKPADGDRSGATGHFHIFVDKEPVKAGQPIPTGDPQIIHTAAMSVDIPGLDDGEHVITVVVGDGTHVALDPLVMATAKVTAGT